MIVIRHRETGATLLEVPADTLAGANLEGAMLLSANLRGADLRGAHLRVADLCQADLREATLDGADLRDADLTLANLVGASFRNASITDARLQGINMGAGAPAGTDFSGADLTRAYLNFSNLTGCRFNDSILQGTDLTRCDLSGAAMVGADLSGANLSNSALTDVDLSYAMLAGALVNDSDLRGASLRHAELAMATIAGSLLCRADLTGAHLSKTVFARCHDLHQALGLDSLRYLSPSCIDLETLRECLGGLPEEFLAGVGVEGREAQSLANGARAALNVFLGRGGESGEYPGDQVLRRLQLANLPLQPVKHARFEVELTGAPGADLQVFLHDLELRLGHPAVEKVVQAPERLFAVGAVELAHAPSRSAAGTIPSSSAIRQSAF